MTTDAPFMGYDSPTAPGHTQKKIMQDMADLRKTQLEDKRQAPSRSAPNSLERLVKALDTIQISDQHELHTVVEAFRALSHRLAVEGMMAAGDLEEGAKAMARAKSKIGVVGPGAGRKIRRTVKALRSMADHFASAGGQAVAAWKFFEQDFADDLNVSRTQVKPRKGFSINPN